MSHLLPEGADHDRARAALEEHLELRAGRARTAVTTFYDTFDGRLYAEGLVLRHADGTLELQDRAAARRSPPATAAPPSGCSTQTSPHPCARGSRT